jgi:hypothetical protein
MDVAPNIVKIMLRPAPNMQHFYRLLQTSKKTAPCEVLPFIHNVIYFNVVVQVTLVPQFHWPLLIAQHLLYGEEVILVQAKSPDWFHLEVQSSADLLGSILVKMMFL